MWPWEYDYKHIEFLWALVTIPLVVAWYIFKTLKNESELKLPSLSNFSNIPTTPLAYFRHIPLLLELVAIFLLTIALARPQTNDETRRSAKTNGIDIVIAMDASGSMLAKDFKPNRLEVCKEVARDFIHKRKNDQIGFVIYEGVAYTESPLTMDHEGIAQKIMRVQPGSLQGGTAVGWGLAEAANRLRESTGKSKVIVLLSDGVNNNREVPPLQIAESAREFDIKVYTIGVGSMGQAKMPVAIKPNGEFIYEYAPVEIDEKTLQEIATITGGKYFRATDKSSLEKIYAEINKLETSEIIFNEYQQKKEEFYPFLFWGVLLLGAGLITKTLFN